MPRGCYQIISNDVNTNKRIQSVFPSPEEKKNQLPSVWFEQINNNNNNNNKVENYVDLQKEESVKLDMKWTTVEYANPIDPRVWGPAFWFTLHNGAARYPIKASPICAERMKGFILGMPIMIPCEKCQDHATSHIEANYGRLDKIVSGREQLFNFFVSFHNYVNERYNKPIMSNEDAYALYTSGVNVTKLEYSSK